MATSSHENVAFIDVDSYKLDDVIIIDDTECVAKNFEGPSASTELRKSPLYIYIDGCSSDEDACSPSRTFPSTSRRHFVKLDGGKSRKEYAFFMGKCRRSNYGKARARNHFSFHISSCSSSSDSDSSDCEVMEGSFEMLKKQWEEASLRRKHDVHGAYFTVDGQDKASSSRGGDSDTNFDVENRTKQQSVQAHSNPENAENGGCCLLTELKSSSAENILPTTLTTKDLVCDRERFKETDEYKQAMEEEWTSRQQQLRIQAEEAQKLRRKRKAERMRLLDMQQRQMKRLEEVRETQKKDEENITLKEQLRVDVRKELSNLEMKCTDMASLLRGLGIQVGSSSLHPSSQEVQAAYKRALLKFHPDRVSSSNIRQLVEAEEKFKLISHMKKTFM